MAEYTVFMLEEGNISISPPGPGVQPGLDGVTQGDGSHLLGRTITLNAGNWVETTIQDDDTSFEDNDTSQQTLFGNQTIGGVAFTGGTRVEAEYRIILTAPDGQTWTAYAYNVNNTNPAYASVEGLAFPMGTGSTPPPIGVPLTVTFASEGPSGLNSNLYDLFDMPPCFTPGTLIETAEGPRPIEALEPGDLVATRDNGLQPLRWVGTARLTAAELAANPEHRPVVLPAGSLGGGLPRRALTLSPQHRVLVGGWRAEVLFGETEVLVPALAFVGDVAQQAGAGAEGVTYLHLLFDRHEIIFAEGAEVESLLPGWLSDASLSPALRAELSALLPRMDSRQGRIPVRPCLTPREGRLVVGGGKNGAGEGT